MPPIDRVLLSASYSCSPEGKNLVSVYVDSMSIADPDQPEKFFAVFVYRAEDQDWTPKQSPVLGRQVTHVFEDLPNGTFQFVGVDIETGRESLPKTLTLSCVTGPPPLVCDLVITAASNVDESNFGLKDGKIICTATTSHGPLKARTFSYSNLSYSIYVNVESNVEFIFNNVTPGLYRLELIDAANCTAQREFTVKAAQKIGCRDPEALNYDPEATVDSGQCEYAPIPVIPFFSVPFMNSLHFKILEETPDFINSFQTEDNTLFCSQKNQGVFNLLYYQKVATGDIFPIQFKSNFTNHFIRLFSEQDVLLREYTATQKVKNDNKSTLFDTNITAHFDKTKIRVYYDEIDIPFGIRPNQIIQILNTGSFDGRYKIAELGQDGINTKPYMVVNLPYPSENISISAAVQLEYDILPFNVYQAQVDFVNLNLNTAYLTIEAQDDREGFGTVTARTEPIFICNTHGNTHLIKYQNLDNSFDINFTTGFVGQIRVESNIFHPAPGSIREVGRDSQGRLRKIFAQKTRIKEFETYLLPDYLHEKISVIMDCDFFTIDGVRYQTEEGYEPEYSDKISLANGSVKLEQVGWLEGANSHDLGTDINNTGGRIIGNGGFIRV